jgi:hypothetical protein
LRENSAYLVRRDDLLWETLVDLDGFLFEARSAYEILGKLLIICFAFLLQKKIQEKDVWDAVREQGVRIDWIEVLRIHRILFFHKTATWLAIRILSREPLRLDWIVMKRNVKTLNDSEDYIDFDLCREIYSGLNATLEAVEYCIEMRSINLRTSAIKAGSSSAAVSI